MPVTRLASVDDAEALCALQVDNREFMAPWDPIRDEDFYTVACQRDLVDQAIRGHGAGTALPLVILDRDEVVGRITISNIVRGAFQSAHLGYWVSQSHNGRGLASAAVAEAVEAAFGELNLHRLEAGTLLSNTGSQRVLARNGFQPFAVAPAYLRIAGRWQDHILFHRLNPAV